MTMQISPQILVSQDGPVATITFNRPDKLNAVTRQTIEEFVVALSQVDTDDSVRAVIVTGSGRAFCAGADVSAGFGLSITGDPATGVGIDHDPGGLATLRLFEMNKPVIGAVNGPAVGFGATVLLPMDYRLTTGAARFAFPFSRRAILPESCSSWFLPRLVGISTALRWMLPGATFDAAEALRGGLVQEIAEPEILLDRAREIANDMISGTSPLSIALTRKLLWNMLGADHPMRAHALESRGLVACLTGMDSEEGWKSFLEKRPPEFRSSPSRDMQFTNSWFIPPEFP